MTAVAQEPQVIQTRPLTTFGLTDLNRRRHQITGAKNAGHCIRLIDHRNGEVWGYVTKEPPPDLEWVADDGTAEALALPPRDPDATKWCPACGSELSLDAFRRDCTRPDGCDTECRACRHAAVRAGRRNGSNDGTRVVA
jgi:hypothetical protein